MRIKLISAIIIASSLTVQAQKTGVKSIDGVKYAVIIASDGALSGFETRNDNDLYYNAKLHIYDGTTNPPLSTSSAKRLVRHTASGDSYYDNGTSWVVKSYNPNQRVSVLFAISPVDVWSDGGTKANDNNLMPNKLHMGWSMANSFLESADAVSISTNIPAQTTGCYMYKGVNGTDPVGTWRVPTQRELQLIFILQIPLSSLKDETLFTKFSSNYYWSATETGLYSSTEAFTVDFTSGLTHVKNKKESVKVRCVRDIK